MNNEKMVYMANQIATFFKTQPGDDQNSKIAAHIKDFWEPRMREKLLAHVDAGGVGLDSRVIVAADMLRP